MACGSELKLWSSVHGQSVVAYFGDEPSGEQVVDLIADDRKAASLAISVAKAGELWYLMVRRSSEADANEAVAELRLRKIPIDFQTDPQRQVSKSKRRMSFGDCFAAALAQRFKAGLLTGTSEFKQVEGDICIAWLKNGG